MVLGFCNQWWFRIWQFEHKQLVLTFLWHFFDYANYLCHYVTFVNFSNVLVYYIVVWWITLDYWSYFMICLIVIFERLCSKYNGESPIKLMGLQCQNKLLIAFVGWKIMLVFNVFLKSLKEHKLFSLCKKTRENSNNPKKFEIEKTRLLLIWFIYFLNRYK